MSDFMFLLLFTFHHTVSELYMNKMLESFRHRTQAQSSWCVRSHANLLNVQSHPVLTAEGCIGQKANSMPVPWLTALVRLYNSRNFTKQRKRDSGGTAGKDSEVHGQHCQYRVSTLLLLYLQGSMHKGLNVNDTP
jgi:hypothetical protein